MVTSESLINSCTWKRVTLSINAGWVMTIWEWALQKKSYGVLVDNQDKLVER